jgi:hypothetical protein
MDTFDDLDGLEQALSRTGQRHMLLPLDPGRLRWRRLRLELGPVVWLLFALALVGAAAVDGRWWLAGGLAIALVPNAVASLLTRHREVGACAGVQDFATYEREYFAAQARQQRSAVVFEAALAIGLGLVALRMGGAERWLAPSLFGVLAAGRAILVLPYVERANRDAGGTRPQGWVLHLLLLLLFLLLPVLLPVWCLRRAWLGIRARIGGRR